MTEVEEVNEGPGGERWEGWRKEEGGGRRAYMSGKGGRVKAKKCFLGYAPIQNGSYVFDHVLNEGRL